MLNAEWQRLHPRLMIQFVRNGILYASEDHWVYRSDDRGKSWLRICRLECRWEGAAEHCKDAILRTEILRRMRRNVGIHNLVVLPSGTILAQYDGIYRFDGTKEKARFVFGFHEERILGPLKNGFVVDDSTGNVYFGEYNNTRPYSVGIIRGSEDGRRWDVCFRFQEGAVKHIHSIVPDPYRKRIWICTGDKDRESGLFYTDDDFQSVHRFAGGSQKWRMIGMLPLADGLVWGSDAGQDTSANSVNYLYYWDFRNQKMEQLACIDKPAYYSMRIEGGGMVIGTSYEPGIKRPVEQSADLWYSTDGLNWERSAAFSFKPSGRNNRTRYATVNMPLGDGTSPDVLVTPENVGKYDFQLLQWQI